MSFVKITLLTVGHLPVEFDRKKVGQWKSGLFEISGPIESYSLPINSDNYNWSFTDTSLEKTFPNSFSGDFAIALVNVPLELNWYSRRLSNNRVVFTFHEMRDILSTASIPLENIVYRLLYAYTLLYLRSGNKIPLSGDHTRYTHDETRGCLFDMNGIKTDVIYSCHQPIICEECIGRLKNDKISSDKIRISQREIKKIKKPLFFVASDFVKKHPIYSLMVSTIFALFLGIIGSLAANVIWEKIKPASQNSEKLDIAKSVPAIRRK